MKNFLLDEFKDAGSDLSSFKEHMELLEENTSLVSFNTENIDIITYVGQISEAKINVIAISPGVWFCISDIAEGLRNGVISISHFNNNSELINEIKGANKTIFRIETEGKKELYLSSTIMNKTFGAKQSGVGGDLLKQSGLKRDIALSQLLEQNPFRGNLLVRRDKKCKKIFGFYSEKHVRMPFTQLYDACKDIDDIKKISWTSDNKKTEILLEFDEKDGYIPGVLLYTSDTSYAPTGVSATLRKSNNRNPFILRAWNNEHYFSVFSNEEITELTQKAKIYANSSLDSLLEKLGEREKNILIDKKIYYLKLNEIAGKTSSKNILISSKYKDINKMLAYEAKCNEKELILKMFDAIDYQLPTYQAENIKKLIAELIVIL